jgi:SagB-type dehydrogenase family enzyme
MDDHHTVLEYHEGSKHQLRRYAPGPGYLDWANQPDPFRIYEGAPRVALPLAADEMHVRFADVRAGQLPAAAPVSLATIGVLLELSLAISAWKSYGGTSWALRCNPSSGNLHPTEGYVVTAGLPGLEGAVYHYVSRDHMLERRARWDPPVPMEHGFVVGLTSIYWREAWKYGMRAFRYCQHDCGHAVASISYAAASLGWQTRMLDTLADEDVAALLGLDRGTNHSAAEREQPDCLLWVGAGEPSGIDVLVTAVRAARWSGSPNRLSTEHVQWPEIDHVHDATRKPRTPPVRSPAGASVRPAPPRLDLAAAAVFRQRRSAVDFDAVTSIPAEVFYAMLEPLLPRSGTPPWNAWPWPPRVHLALFVHRVEGLEPGLYAFLREDSALETLRRAMRPEWLWRRTGPAHLPLYLLLAHDTRDTAKVICCHQDIAADSCFALGMLASFEGVAQSPWRYRSLYWECGLVGQTLYLEAEAAGIRATGIGCFFDDEMHRLLGLEGTAWQSLYHFTAGGAVDDPRLTTLPAYGPRAPH